MKCLDEETALNKGAKEMYAMDEEDLISAEPFVFLGKLGFHAFKTLNLKRVQGLFRVWAVGMTAIF